MLGAHLKGGGGEDLYRQGRKLQKSRTLTDVNRRYFGICGRFSAESSSVQEVSGSQRARQLYTQPYSPTQMMADEFSFFWSQIQHYVAEADLI